MALITEDAKILTKVALIGVAPSKHPSRIDLQEWVNVNLTEPHKKVTRIRMLPKGYFVLTFEQERGATEALQQSPLAYGSHYIYLHPWRSQFNPEAPMGINIPIWIRFPKLDDCYYRALPELCDHIGKVV
jgi:hypothetical protein